MVERPKYHHYRSDQTRVRILQSLKILHARYDRIPTQQALAREAGCDPATVRRHFPDLQEALLSISPSPLWDRVVALVPTEPAEYTPMAATLWAFCRAADNLTAEDLELIRKQVMLSTSSASACRLVNMMLYRDFGPSLEDALRRRRNAAPGAPMTLEETSAVCLALTVAMAAPGKWFEDRCRRPLGMVVHQLVDILADPRGDQKRDRYGVTVSGNGLQCVAPKGELNHYGRRA